MFGKRSFHRRWSLLLIAACFAVLPACAATTSPAQNPRNFDATHFGHPVNLGPDWLFHPGDNPAWAAPNFDDGQWNVISSQRLLLHYGYKNLKHGWYRIHVHLRPGTHDFSIGVRYITGAYQIYANGTPIGGNGNVAQAKPFAQPRLKTFPIPQKLLDPNGALTLAIRVAMNPVGKRGRGTDTPIASGTNISLLATSSAAREINNDALDFTLDYWILAFLSLVIAIVSAALYGTLRSHPEYLACTVLLLAICGSSLTHLWIFYSTQPAVSGMVLALMNGIFLVALIEFVRLLLGLPRWRWLIAIQVLAFLHAFAEPLAANLGLFSFYIGFGIFFVPLLIVYLTLPALLAYSGWRGKREAWVVLPTILVLGLYAYWEFIGFFLYYTHITATVHLEPNVHLGILYMRPKSFDTLLFLISILLFLVIRTVGIARRNAQVNAELQAARSTQELLLARSHQKTPGFSVETAYAPAGELGGDFFLVSPQNDGSLSVIVGDVSGKGLIAALRVSMILGILRREESIEPSKVLTHLNNALAADHDSGFTTACCLHIAPDGAYTLANAGHISPYLDGKELPAPPGLPLGVVADQKYETTTGRIHNGQHLVLISDGVVEARDAKGNLLGFDRLPDLTQQLANHIMDAARNFGQEDDITVLRIALGTAPATVAAPAATPQLSPA